MYVHTHMHGHPKCTAGLYPHGRQVPVLARLLTQGACNDTQGALKVKGALNVVIEYLPRGRQVSFLARCRQQGVLN